MFVDDLNMVVNLCLDGDDYCIKVMEIDSLYYPYGASISYTMETFMLLLNQDDDDESAELESEPSDVATKYDMDRNTFIAAADMDNFELLYDSTMHIYRWYDS
jgi:hypothetical protein